MNNVLNGGAMGTPARGELVNADTAPVCFADHLDIANREFGRLFNDGLNKGKTRVKHHAQSLNGFTLAMLDANLITLLLRKNIGLAKEDYFLTIESVKHHARSLLSGPSWPDWVCPTLSQGAVA